MRTIACIVGLGALLSLATAQFTLGSKTYSLSPSKLIAEGAENIVWSSDGSDLAFSTKDKVGVYSLERNESQALITLEPKETVDQVTWLEKGHQALAFTRKPNPNADTKDILTIRILDSRQMTCRSLYETEVAKGADAGAEVMSSPLLPFALIEFSGEKTSKYLVLTQNGARLIKSPDIDQAVKEGKEFSAWSANGTALFGPVMTLGLDSQTLTFVTTSGDLARVTGDKGETFAIKLSGAKLISDKGGTFSFSIRPRANFAPGQAVLECMPSNGTLRSVRFNGEYEEPPAEPEKFRLFDQDVALHLGQTTATTKALWLVRVAKENSPEAKAPTAGLLISPQAQEWWYAPHERAIAYRDHGSVFVRTLIAKN